MPAPCRASSLLLPPPSFVSFLSSTPPLRFCAPCTAAARPLPGPASDTPSGRAGLAMLCSPLLQSLCGLPPGARPSRSLPPRSALPRSRLARVSLPGTPFSSPARLPGARRGGQARATAGAPGAPAPPQRGAARPSRRRLTSREKRKHAGHDYGLEPARGPNLRWPRGYLLLTHARLLAWHSPPFCGRFKQRWAEKAWKRSPTCARSDLLPLRQKSALPAAWAPAGTSPGVQVERRALTGALAAGGSLAA